jgi:hypothetical protein
MLYNPKNNESIKIFDNILTVPYGRQRVKHDPSFLWFQNVTVLVDVFLSLETQKT